VPDALNSSFALALPKRSSTLSQMSEGMEEDNDSSFEETFWNSPILGDLEVHVTAAGEVLRVFHVSKFQLAKCSPVLR
jgi:hypothetical protein